MKKFFIALVAVFAMSTMANAQIKDLGVRIGGGEGFGTELSAQWGFMGQRLETDLGWHSDDNIDEFNLSGIYQWTGDIGSGFNWFAGVGARLAIWSYANTSDFALALAGQAGIEYNFDAVPIQLTLDIRPCFWIICPGDPDFHWGDIALGIRYRF